METEQTIAEISGWSAFSCCRTSDPLSASDLSAANRRHDDALAHSPWFRLWQRYGVCCRGESPTLRRGSIQAQKLP